VQAASIEAIGRTVEIGRRSGVLVQTRSPAGRHVVAIDYRFVLAPGAVPGTYAWPLDLAVRAPLSGDRELPRGRPPPRVDEQTLSPSPTYGPPTCRNQKRKIAMLIVEDQELMRGPAARIPAVELSRTQPSWKRPTARRRWKLCRGQAPHLRTDGS
jgi:hypothetical protein